VLGDDESALAGEARNNSKAHDAKYFLSLRLL